MITPWLTHPILQIDVKTGESKVYPAKLLPSAASAVGPLGIIKLSYQQLTPADDRRKRDFSTDNRN